MEIMALGRRLVWLGLAAALVAPAAAQAAPRQPTAVRSPCGKHVLTLDGGAVMVDGRRVQAASGAVELVASPVWRRDGGAVAWIERRNGEVRLMVLPALGRGTLPLPWALPPTGRRERVFWAGKNRVVVGTNVLAPRAVASWSS